eukprot:TRINITY_DN10202_c0_g1_i1.p1 TRINITY_DN10202_c0_g1~~TRINITY_DN10202_c0_g1_i1.p1  ORF type:complete len:404 (+),score=107.89 TRINITY_DN10202_c0_g1_i1:56-1213(+)
MAIECNPLTDCKTLRQCDRNFLEKWAAASARTDEVKKIEEQCQTFRTYYTCAVRVGSLYLPQVEGWCANFNASDACPEVCEKPTRIGEVPEEVTISIHSSGNQLEPKCESKKVFRDSVPVGVCLENDEYGFYRLDVVDGYVSKEGGDGKKVAGLKLQFQLGCEKDENGECHECGHIGEVHPDVCQWGCQQKSPEKDCYSFWASGFEKDYNPYTAVGLNISITSNKDCDDEAHEGFANRVFSEGAREASLNAQTVLSSWGCSKIEAPETKKRQEVEKTSNVWIYLVFTGKQPRIGAELAKAKFTGGGENNDLIILGNLEALTVQPVSNVISVYEEEGNIEESGLSGGAIFGIVVLALIVLIVAIIAAYVVAGKSETLLGKKEVEKV